MAKLHKPESELTILNNMTAVTLDVSLWTARKKLHAEDIGLNSAELPPEELAALGSKRIAPPEKLRVFANIKSRAAVLLSRNGVRFLSGWLIPDAKKKVVLKELQVLRDEFMQAKASFLAEYDSAISEWLERNAEWKDLLAGSTVSPDYVDRQLQFGWHAYRLSLKGAGSDFKESVRSVASTLFDEIAADAAAMWKDVFSGRDSVNHRALGPLATLESKLAGLICVEPRVAPVVSLIHTAIGRLPVTGRIYGADLAGLQGIVCLLKDRDALLGHAQSILDGSDPGLVLNSLTATGVKAKSPSVVARTVASNAVVNSMGLW